MQGATLTYAALLMTTATFHRTDRLLVRPVVMPRSGMLRRGRPAAWGLLALGACLAAPAAAFIPASFQPRGGPGAAVAAGRGAGAPAVAAEGLWGVSSGRRGVWLGATVVSAPETASSSSSPQPAGPVETRDGDYAYTVEVGGTVAEPGDSVLRLADGQGRGVATVVFHERRGKALRILSVEVAPEARGQGLGRRAVLSLVERFLNRGGKVNQVSVPASEASAVGFFEGLGMVRRGDVDEDGKVHMVGDADRTLESVKAFVGGPLSNSSTALNVLGRLEHARGEYEAAAGLYTRALTLRPNDSALFQNLGGAYASQGEHQMAFASFQRAIDLDPEDRYTYLKLGMMYESLAKGKFKEAAEHALKCYEFYLDGEEGRHDTDALTIHGNLLVRRLEPEAAVRAYQRALSVDPTLFNVWFNLANAQLTLGRREDAAESLRRTLHINPNVTAARHLLRTLTDSDRVAADSMDPAYVVELFDYYAATYDQHMKEGLLYTAPRMLRQEVRKVFNRTMLAEDEGIDVLRALNKSLRILDLGCGTGLVGAWFTDYSARMVGVDISPKMVEKARTKLVYDELYVADLTSWLGDATGAGAQEPFDVVVCADVLQYLGSLDETLRAVAPLIKARSGLFAFTLEELVPGYHAPGEPEAEAAKRGFMLGPSGRFLYTRAYVDRVLREAGLVAETFLPYSPRVERGEPVPGFLYVVRAKRGEAI